MTNTTEILNQTALKTIISVGTLAKEGIVKTCEIVQQQFPQLCSEIIKFNLYKNLFWVSFGLFLIFVGILFIILGFYLTNKHIKTKNQSYMEAGGMCIVATLFTGLFGLIFILSNITELIKCYFAPKLFLIEYFANLIKGNI